MSYSFITLLKNVNYLLQNKISESIENASYNTMMCVEDYCMYELKENLSKKNNLTVLNYEDTVELLLRKPKSFCRFGDGEINLINGQSIPFQKYDRKLAEILEEILKTDCNNIYVGINYNYFHSTKNMNEYNRRVYLLHTHLYRDYLEKNCYRNREYIAAGFNQQYMVVTNETDLSDYYRKIKELFRGKSIAIFAGDGILDGLKYDVFELARSKKIIAAPNKNSFSEYGNLLDKARKLPTNSLICFILGPTSKALVYQLSKEGYIAWDIGHLAKDYDAYMRNEKKSQANIVKFFSPD